ncbi:MAG TPA: penicillin acylase family protein [Vicinamibacteria bacterium]|nr:penicillin acylase family protein [Vicinamibacteria bacterium]
MSATAMAEPVMPAPRGRWALRSAVAVLATLALVASPLVGTWLVWTRRALPRVDGEERLPGLAATVTVRRDGLGVPHLQAGSIADALRAQGYVTAQDRLWHMDVLRRRALGELAEAFGDGLLRADREVRTLGLGLAARQELPQLSGEARAAIESYAAGVNAYITERKAALPLEFRLLRYEPRPWTAVDTLAVGMLLSHDLAQGWEAEAGRALLDTRLPPEVMDLLYPSRFADDRVLFGDDTPLLTSPVTPAEHARGSNNWVISGAHTATGKPLLANDPHLALGVPSIWTAVHLSAPGLEVAGVTMPGVPGVILGRNRRVAWGCTNVQDDSADLYLEQFDPRRPDHYRTALGWEKVAVRSEPIRVREGQLSRSWRTVDHEVRHTTRGPIVEVRGRLYSLRWTMHTETGGFDAFLRMDRAESWDDFREALRRFPGPAQNFVYADVDGRIAWYSAGRLPVRRAGDGSRPYSGASADGDWLGYVAFEELPHVVDPPSGRLVTANNRLVGSAYPHRVTRGGVGPWRAAAIFEGLEARAGWTADDIARLQGERLSIPHRDLARALLEAAARHPGDSLWQDAARELSGWDGRLDAESRPGALAVATLRALGDRVIGPRLEGVPSAEALRRRPAAVHRIVRERPAAWLPSGDVDWDATFRAVWADGVAELTRTLGRDRERWRHGALNRVQIRHPLSRAVPGMGWLLDPPAAEMGGATTTPNVLGLAPGGGVEGPSMRFVADLADPDNTRLVNFMGQSGHVASPHYGDQLEPWLRVESRRMPFTPEAVAREARHTLRLVP